MSAMSHADQVEYRSWIRSGLEKVAPLERTRRLVEAGDRDHPDLWRDLVELGVLGLAVPEALGGADVPAAGLGILLEEAGRLLVPAPYFVTAVLTPLTLRRAGAENVFAPLLTAIAEGEARVGLAVSGGTPPGWSAALPRATAAADGGWTLSGEVGQVLDGDRVSHVLLAAEINGSPALFLVEVAAIGVTVEVGRPLDPSRPVARIVLDQASGSMVGDLDHGPELIAELADLLRVALAADAVGGARRLLEMSVDYAKTRVQFGRQIGEFQSIKHRCADLFVAVEAAAAAVEGALADLDESGQVRPASVSVASIYAAEAYWSATRTAMQIHGGLSLTWEHEVHLYLKRATSSAHLLGNPDRELSRLAGIVLADGYDVVAELIG